MTLTPSSKLGPYEILSLLGAGGMGEVYRARDTRLDRTVAIKVLPSGVSSTPEQRQRFEREARAISRLSHPHICALYDVGREGDTEYLVMEFLEGEPLSTRLARGALPLEQTCRFGAEIADALEKAHRQGIVHRDLKPGNVMLTKTGVKLLDFGLARVTAPAVSPSDLTSNPTATVRSELTQEGALLGTLAYMAPEQLEGKEADARSDVFALGTTLYEMATGRKAFSGASRASLISSILRDHPKPVSQVEPMSPRSLDRIIERCLEKDSERRWQSAADVGLELGSIARGELAEPAIGAARATRAPRWLVGLAAAGLAAAAVAASFALRRPAASPEPPIRFSVRPPQGARFPWVRMQNFFAASPDGRRIAFVARGADGVDALWIRTLADPLALRIAGTEGAAAPFWSPDARFLAFFADGKLKKIDASGGAAESLCDAPPGYPSGSWGSRHTILFAALTDQAVHVVPDAGGSPRAVVAADPERKEVGVAFPSFLPDGNHFLYLGRSEAEKRAYVRLASVDGGGSQPLLTNCSRAEYVSAGAGEAGRGAAGYLLFARDGSLYGQPFDLRRLRAAGDPFSLGQDIWQHVLIGSGPFSASGGGLLASRANAGPSRLVWLDRAGRETGSLESPAGYDSVRLSPEGKRVAVQRVDAHTGLHEMLIGDLSRQVLTRLDLGPIDLTAPVWSPDGARIAFSVGSMRHPPSPYWVSLHGPATPAPIVSPAEGTQRVEDWSPDGRYLLSWGFGPSGAGHGVIDLQGERKLKIFASGNLILTDAQAQFSPDGRWIALCLQESGRSEVYLTPFPAAGERIRVSASGGMLPRWRRDGRELYYVSADNQLMAAPVRLGSDAQLGAPQALFRPDPSGWRDYDVTADGSRFLAIVNVPVEDSGAIAVTVNWLSALRR